MNNDDINDYMPSLLNPRAVRKAGDLSMTQNYIVSRCSLSLKRKNGLPTGQKFPENIFVTGKENKKISSKLLNKNTGKENIQNSAKLTPSKTKHSKQKATIDDFSIGLSAIEDLHTVRNSNNSSSFSLGDVFDQPISITAVENINNLSLVSVSSATELLDDSNSTIQYDLSQVAIVSVSFGVNNCEKIDLSTKNTSIKNILVSHKDNTTNIDCELLQNFHTSLSGSDTDENMDTFQHSPEKRSAVAVNLEMKKKKLSKDGNEDSKVLILNTDDIGKLTHVIVQPPNYKLVKRQIQHNSKLKNSKRTSCVSNGACVQVGNLKQKRIDSYLRKSVDVVNETLLAVVGSSGKSKTKDGEVMSKNLGVVDSHGWKLPTKRREETSPHSSKLRARESESSRAGLRVSQSDARRVASAKHDSGSSHSPRRQVDSLQFSLTTKTKSAKSSLSPRNIPHYKIVAGTHIAVDAFSYGDIPNVKHYFLTHFHSDHYAGLKKSFKKFLFCSKITADLCMSRLGVCSKNIHVINNDETFTIDGIEVTAVDANHYLNTKILYRSDLVHPTFREVRSEKKRQAQKKLTSTHLFKNSCPGAIMLVFSLPNGKTLLHTGDFRASPDMESYPVLWNKDINTVYLDTTYCNPRYDFPTQDQSLDMALYLLRQKKLVLEKSGKKFSSVLIVCGTYTIGKEKFFLGMARRVGCSVWACPEKDRVLRAVEGRSFSHAPAHSCQLHVVPMRDLMHEKLRSYLDSLQGAFTEVVAFKPSGWENGKNSTVEKDGVTIHGIPYSEHSSFSELIRFVKFLRPKQVVPTVDISGGVKSVQKYFPCPLLCQEEMLNQSKLTDFFSIQSRPQGSAVT